MPLPPFPVPPNPRTWAAGDLITEERLRADLGNAALLFANRPLLVAQQTTTAQAITSGVTQLVDLDTELLDNWGGHQIPSPSYVAPFSGWYLAEGNWFALSTATKVMAAGISKTQNGVTISNDGAKIAGNGSALGSPACCDLVQLIAQQGDSVALTAWQDSASTVNITTGSFGAYFKAEWVGLPSTANGYTGSLRLGTVVPSPPAPAAWPPGAGTTVANAGGITAGATSVTVASATGLINGGVLVLDKGALIAETVTITSVAGTTIGFTPATLFTHAHAAPVGTPLGHAWLNSQCRDLINFLAYPPMLRAQYVAGSATLPNQTWPAGTLIPISTASPGVDNFGGFSGSTHLYTFPVGGVYDVYGQVYASGSGSAMSLGAGIQVSGGSILWGDTGLNVITDSANYQGVTVKRTVRVTAGQTVGLYGTQNSGSSLALQGSAGKFCLLIAVFRGYQVTTPPAPTVPVFTAGYMPSDADFGTWWYQNAGFFSQRVVFRGRLASSQSITFSGLNVLEFDTVDEDPYSGWNASTWHWEPAISGWYQVNVLAFLQGVPAQVMARPSVNTPFFQYNVAATLPPTGHPGGTRGSFPVYLTGGQDTVCGCVTMLNAPSAATVTTSSTPGQLSAMEIVWICD